MKAVTIAIILGTVGAMLISSAHGLHKILFGNETTIEKHPYQVAFVYVYQSHVALHCGGTIISTKFVLTAAHCSPGENETDIWASFGSSSFANGHLRKVTKWIVHPDYELARVLNDIALAGFAEEITLGPCVAIISLATQSHLEAGTLLTVTGWGLTESHVMPDILREVDVPVFDQKKCERMWPDITERKLCLGGYPDDKRNTCSGDSGGPAVKDGVQYGIVSYHFGSCQSEAPHIFTRVSYYYDWIMEKMDE